MTYSAAFLLLFLTAFLILAVMWCARTILLRKTRPPRKPAANKYTGDGDLLICSFCRKDQHSVRKLIAGPEAFICDECAEQFAIRTRSAVSEHWIAATKSLPKPAEIHAVLDPCLNGDSHTKRRLAIILHAYYRFLLSGAQSAGAELPWPWPKPNILLAGPDRLGKRRFAQTLAGCLGVPFETIDAADFADRDRIFKRVTDLATALDRNAGAARARRAIVYIDGIEQICRPPDGATPMRAPSGEIGQTALAELLSGTIYSVRSAHLGDPFFKVGPLTRAPGTDGMVADCAEPPEDDCWGPANAQAALVEFMTGLTIWIEGKPTRLNPDNDLGSIDTTNILFICGVTPDDQMTRRASDSTGAGNAAKRSRRTDATPSREDLYRLGFLPDLIDCLPLKFAMTGPRDG